MTVFNSRKAFVVLWLALTLFLSAQGWSEQTTSPPLENFRLVDARGESHELYRLAKAKALVLFVHGLGCAIVDRSMEALTRMREDFGKRGIQFWMINANKNDSRDRILQHMSEFHYDIPVLVDPTQVVARALAISRTAEAMVIDPTTWKIIYRGPIDDGTGGYGVERNAPKNAYLASALEAVLGGHLDKIPKAGRTLGCLVRFDQDQVPSYAREVAPILKKKCAYCHDARQGLWKLDSYATVKNWAPMIRETLMTQIMPPFWPDIAAEELAGREALTVKEQVTLYSWIEGGAPRGTGPDPLIGRKAKGQWSGTPEMILHSEEPVQIPANGVLDYRYLKLVPEADHDLWIRGIENSALQSGSFHHAIVFLVPPGVSAGKFVKNLSEVEGYRNATMLTNISLPVQSQLLSGPFAYLIPKGYSLLLEAHLRTRGHPVTFTPEFGVYLAHGPKVRRVRHLGVGDDQFTIPPGEANYKIHALSRVFTKPVDIVGVSPHMHLRSKSMKFAAVFPDGHTVELLSLPNFNSAWRRRYQFVQPRHLPAGSRIVLDGAFDNSSDNPSNPDASKSIKFGESLINSEMFLGNVYYAEAEVEPLPSTKP